MARATSSLLLERRRNRMLTVIAALLALIATAARARALSCAARALEPFCAPTRRIIAGPRAARPVAPGYPPMSNLTVFVVLYLLASIAIGLVAALRVHNSSDFVVAGRHLPLPLVTATVFATWFGAETVLGISATFVKDGLGASWPTRSARACA